MKNFEPIENANFPQLQIFQKDIEAFANFPKI